MCGIAGVLDRNGLSGADLARLARAMGEAIAHRGPDGDGLWVDDSTGVAFAHRRLAILGLGPEGTQPMLSSNHRWVICYNGEVYNFRVLKEHPSLSDVAWRGNSDTEVILESIARRGIEATLDDMNGMFAFALFDRRDRKLHLVRDRLGIKPLYFRAEQDRVIFGSELKALRAAGGSFEINPEALASYLRLAYVPEGYSIFKGVGKLRPGEMLSICAKGIIERRLFWNASEVAESGLAKPFVGSDAQAEDALHDLLADAVRSQLISEVPLGLFLSGGIDSATIAALATATSGRVQTFSIGFPELGFNEAPHAEELARHLGTQHTTLMVTPAEALNVVPLLPEMYDEPFADSSQIPTHLVSKLSRDTVTVALSGDGGDELFAGYTRHVFAARRWPLLSRFPHSARRSFGSMLGLLPRRPLDAISGMLPGVPTHLGLKVDKLSRTIGLEPEELYRQLVSQIGDPSVHVEAKEAAPVQLAGEPKHLLDRMRLSDMKGYLPGDVLTKVDRASMAVALEARPPFLDHRVVEFAWRLPQHLLVRDGRSKWLLRRVLERYVPRELIDRPKQGFGVPLADWLRGPLRDYAGDLIGSADYGGGYLKPKPAQTLLSEHLSGQASNEYALWTLLMFEAWRRGPAGP